MVWASEVMARPIIRVRGSLSSLIASLDGQAFKSPWMRTKIISSVATIVLMNNVELKNLEPTVFTKSSLGWSWLWGLVNNGCSIVVGSSIYGSPAYKWTNSQFQIDKFKILTWYLHQLILFPSFDYLFCLLYHDGLINLSQKTSSEFILVEGIHTYVSSLTPTLVFQQVRRVSNLSQMRYQNFLFFFQ